MEQNVKLDASVIVTISKGMSNWPDSAEKSLRKACRSCDGIQSSAKRDNVRVHRAAANKLNIESRATRGSVCNALLSTALSSFQCCFCLRVSSAKPAAVINAETIIQNEISRVNCRREYHRQRSSSQLLMSSGSFPPDFDKPSSPVE